jgi:enamine deaminase RidA (YjgF/YER057c/UK114 family)
MSGRIAAELAARGIALPAVFSPPPGVVLPFDLVRAGGGLLHISGHGPMDGAHVLMRGKVGSDLDAEQAYQAARLTGLSILASLERELGDLDRIGHWVKALGFVNCAPGFNATPRVINGFSDLVLELWGEEGRHARSAIGVAELPFDIPVEVEAVVAPL